MKHIINYILNRFMPQRLRAELKKREQLKKWKSEGFPVPAPHIVKQMVIQEYQKRYSIAILVETGTYLGHMIEAQKNIFKKIYSIELGQDLFDKAVDKFKQDRYVLLFQGDSGKVLPEIVSQISEPAIFWLDGHYSEGITAKGEKECPILEELAAIFAHGNYNHVLLIDDARCFTGQGDYPSIDELVGIVKNKNENYQVEVKHDVIRFSIS